jgi:hypothetical protein
MLKTPIPLTQLPMKSNALASSLLIAALLCACASDPQTTSGSAQDAATRSTTAVEASAPSVAVVGALAPDFELADQNGSLHRLSAFRGKPVVLEWFNEGCPFVKKWYSQGDMQALQQKYTSEGVVWLTICSSAEGKQGFIPAGEAASKATSLNMHSTALMRDVDGSVGKAFAAKTTPHMFVIDAAGQLVYSGAIDSNSSASQSSIAGADNHVANTLDALLAGTPVKPRATAPYGCGVKYAN